jgi:hypothetical protein
MPDTETPVDIEAKAAASVALTLLIHTLAFQLRRERITRAELDEIFETVTEAYSSPIVPPATETWQRQIQSLVTLARIDVLQRAQAG